MKLEGFSSSPTHLNLIKIKRLSWKNWYCTKHLNYYVWLQTQTQNRSIVCSGLKDNFNVGSSYNCDKDSYFFLFFGMLNGVKNHCYYGISVFFQFLHYH